MLLYGCHVNRYTEGEIRLRMVTVGERIPEFEWLLQGWERVEWGIGLVTMTVTVRSSHGAWVFALAIFYRSPSQIFHSSPRFVHRFALMVSFLLLTPRSVFVDPLSQLSCSDWLNASRGPRCGVGHARVFLIKLQLKDGD